MEHAEAESSQQARALAEQAMQAQAAGNTNEVERMLSEAQQLDRDAVAIVLNEHDAAVAPDARDTPTANQDTGRVRRMEPDTNPAAYPGSTGAVERGSAAPSRASGHD